MVTLGPLKFSDSSKRLLDDNPYVCKFHHHHAKLTTKCEVVEQPPKRGSAAAAVSASATPKASLQMLDYERRRLKNLSNQLSLSSPTSPALFRRERNPPMETSLAAAVERRALLTPKLCRKVTAGPDNPAIRPKSDSNDQTTTASCRLVKAAARSVMLDKDCNNNNSSEGLANKKNHSSTSSANSSSAKPKSSISSNSRDTSIESIIPKYKSYSCYSKTKNPVDSIQAQSASNGMMDGSQKRSYNPRLSIRTNKFILNDKNEAKKSNIVIPRKTSCISNCATNAANETHIRGSFRVIKTSGSTTVQKMDMERKAILDSEPGFFNRDQSNESLYIDFSKKVPAPPPPRSPSVATSVERSSPLAPEKENECCVVYKFEVVKKNEGVVRSHLKRAIQVAQPILYVSCASWVPKCNNKFSFRERRLLEESKAISRKSLRNTDRAKRSRHRRSRTSGRRRERPRHKVN